MSSGPTSLESAAQEVIDNERESGGAGVSDAASACSHAWLVVS